MFGRKIFFVLLVCAAFLSLLQGSPSLLYSAEILLPDLYDDGTATYDAKDLFRIAVLWMSVASTPEEGDFNGDGFVDMNDLLPLADAYFNDISPNYVNGEEMTPTADPNATPTATPTSTIDPNATPTTTPTNTLDPNATPTGTPTNTIDPNATPTATPTSTIDPNATPTSAPTPTYTPTPPEPTDTPTPEATNTPTNIETNPTSTPTPTPPDDATETPTPASGAPTNTPTPQPTVAQPTPQETPTVYQPEYVRLWELHPSFKIFNESVEIPPSGGYASSDEGYAVFADTSTGESSFISFDRFGRIFNRTLPISSADYSGIALSNGGSAFGKFFESPQDTRRFRFEPFTLEAVAGTIVSVEHLGADAIAWAFCGSETGYAMAVLRYPNTIAIHRIDSNGQYLGITEHQIGGELPTRPVMTSVAVSGDAIAVVYSNNYNAGLDSAAPVTAWVFSTDGELLTPTPHTISDSPLLDRMAVDGQETFFLVTQSLYGPRLIRFSQNGVLLNRIVQATSLVDIQWQDGLLYYLDGGEHSMTGLNEEGLLSNGPVSLYPPGWSQTPEWQRLQKSGPDLGAFFYDPSNSGSLHYMQIEAGDLATPTPLPAPGTPTGVTSTIEIEEGVTIEMIKIARGTFLQGSPDSEQDRRSNEGPQHTVTLTYDYYISTTEITNLQYAAFNPGKQPPSYGSLDLGQDNLPVTGVSWEDANEFCEWLSNQTDYTFSLPTEAEWEYAARGGTTTRRYWGRDLEDEQLCSYANVADIRSASEFAFIEYNVEFDDGFAGPAPVGSFPPNPLGLYDMMGNVHEWCLDWFEKYSGDNLTDPLGPERGKSRILRGGSWLDNPTFARSAYRSGRPPDETDVNVGFRVVIRDE